MSTRVLPVALCFLAACYGAHEPVPTSASVDIDGGASDRADRGVDAGDADVVGPADTDTRAPSEILATCLEAGELQCAGNERCCRNEDRRLTGEACLDVMRELCERFVREPHVREGNLRLNAAELAAVLDEARAALMTCETVPMGNVLEGRLGLGDDCTPASTVVWVFPWACEDGLACIPTEAGAIRGTCGEPSPEGGPCWTEDACADGLHCDPGADGSFPGRCAPPRGVGAPCSNDFQCESHLCRGNDPNRAEDEGVCGEPDGYGWCLLQPG